MEIDSISKVFFTELLQKHNWISQLNIMHFCIFFTVVWDRKQAVEMRKIKLKQWNYRPEMQYF